MESPLGPGTKLGAYEIVAKLGEGGMGQVFRARDARLGRDVALKVLPELFARDPDRIARFDREARALAALNHPNIAQIYGIETDGAPGLQTRGQTALVMELVEGEDLSTIVSRGAIGWPDALPIARQIADALEAAHEQNIIHRDLKPANIKVRTDGVVKVLDFGLAKALAGPEGPASADAMNSPTLTNRATQLGMILGSAAYMAPEQAKGKPADKRADVWAFGVVLYEMLTGRGPFLSETVPETLAHVMTREVSLSSIPADVPPRIRRLIGRCLVKDPRQRLRDIGEARVLIDDTIAGRTDGEVGSAAVSAAGARTRGVGVWPWAVAALAIVIALAAWTWPRRVAAVSAPVMRLTVDLPPDVEVFSTPLISANGQTIAFVGVRQGVRQVYYRRLSESPVHAIRGSETTGPSLAISPDGNAVAFVTSDSRLNRVTLDGGVPQTIAQKADFVFGLAWLKDEIIFGSEQQLMRVNATGGDPRPLTPLDITGGETKQDFPVVSTTTPLVIFRSARGEGGANMRMEAVSIETGRRYEVAGNDVQIRWFSATDLVLSKGDALFVKPFDAAAARLATAEAPLATDVGSVIGGLIGASVSDNGSVVYVTNSARQSQLVWVASDGAESPLPLGARGFQNPRVSPDGRLIAFVAADGLWVIETARGAITKAGEPGASFPIWMPDSRRIVVKDFNGRVVVVNADATGKPVPIPGSTTSDYPASTTPDGKTVAMIRLSPATSGDVFLVPVEGGAATALIQTLAYDGAPQISPDGKWLAYSSDESKVMEVYLRRLDDPNQRWTVSTQGGLHPLWSRDGRRIYYRTNQQVMVADVVLEPEVKMSLPRLVVDRRYEFGPNISQPNYSLSDDGQRLLMVKPDPGAQALQLILNSPVLVKR